MISKKILDLLQSSKKRGFSLAELANYLAVEKNILKVVLSRMSRQKKIYRLFRGHYSLPQKMPDLDEFAVQINPNSYLSLEYALSLYGILSQTPAQLTLVTIKRSKQYNAAGRIIEYAHIKPPLFFGYKIIGKSQLAYPEKALLDELYLIGLKKRKLDIRELDLKKLNKKLIRKWLRFYPPSTTRLVEELKLL